MSTILVVTEIRDGEIKGINYEAYSAAKKLAQENNQSVTALLVGSNLTSLAEIPAKYGIEQVTSYPPPKAHLYSKN